ncbi:DUF6205 family protein [Streptomyces sp. NPDC058947]|uniref:DUF6205 family protein n=1 Tax=Streptomyces sp. NPDC058947 TaxID=3346675 RepID=UPI0036C554A1
MSLRLVVRGEFRIDPPLKWSDIRNSRFLPADHGGTEITDIVLQVQTETTDDDEGVRTLFTCDRVVPWTRAPYSPTTMLENVEDLRTECSGHSVTGEMVLYDTERVGYVTRVVSDRDGVREERARLVWPDGSEVEPLY